MKSSLYSLSLAVNPNKLCNEASLYQSESGRVPHKRVPNCLLQYPSTAKASLSIPLTRHHHRYVLVARPVIHHAKVLAPIKLSGFVARYGLLIASKACRTVPLVVDKMIKSGLHILPGACSLYSRVVDNIKSKVTPVQPHVTKHEASFTKSYMGNLDLDYLYGTLYPHSACQTRRTNKS
jgi:hypothetical protein